MAGLITRSWHAPCLCNLRQAGRCWFHLADWSRLPWSAAARIQGASGSYAFDQQRVNHSKPLLNGGLLGLKKSNGTVFRRDSWYSLRSALIGWSQRGLTTGLNQQRQQQPPLSTLFDTSWLTRQTRMSYLTTTNQPLVRVDEGQIWTSNHQ